MKPSSGTLWFLRIFVCVVALVFAVGYYGHVRAQAADSDPSGTAPSGFHCGLSRRFQAFRFLRYSAWKESSPIKQRRLSWEKPCSGTCRQAAMISRRAPAAISMPEQTAGPTTK